MKRSKLEIYMNFLSEIANGKSKITQIANGSEIARTRNYLVLAENRREVKSKPEGKGNSYSLTKDGLKILDDWKKYQSFLESIRSFMGGYDEKK